MKSVTFKRRGFLGILGGAIVAPLMPSASFGAATKAAYPASALHAAIIHAQTRVNFSVFALAQQLGLQLGQAEALMGDMSKRGILGPLQGTTQSGRWARSHVLRCPLGHAAAVQKMAQTKHNTASAKPTKAKPFEDPDLSQFLAHLYDICRTAGIPLHPRCAA